MNLDSIQIGDRVEISYVTGVLGLRQVPGEPTERDALIKLPHSEEPEWVPLGMCKPFKTITADKLRAMLENTTADMLIEDAERLIGGRDL